jgi:hypothetical protein
MPQLCRPGKYRMRSFWKHLLTGKDNRSFDIGRVILFEAVQSYIVLTAYFIFKGGAFDFIAYGTGLAALLAAGGAGIALKSGTEPEPLSIRTKDMAVKIGKSDDEDAPLASEEECKQP